MIQYDFDSDFLFARNTRQLTDIAEYARVSKAQNIEVTGYRGSTLLSNGSVMIEKPDVSRLRAERVAEVLRGPRHTGIRRPLDFRTGAGRQRRNGLREPPRCSAN